MTEQALYEEIHRRLDYNPKTGVFTWKEPISNRIKTGMEAGSISREGYWLIGIFGKVYFAHRLAWIYVHGNFPKGQLDHINGVKNDNRICNLRIATNQQNKRNTYVQRNNKLGVKGVSLISQTNRYRAQITANKKTRHIGCFKTLDEAAAAYRQAAMEIDPVFYRVD